MSYPNQPPPDNAYVVNDGEKFGSLETEAGIRNRIKNPVLGAYGRGQDNLWGEGGFLGLLIGALTNGQWFNLGGASTYTAEQYATMNDHTQQIAELVEAFDQLTLQGNAIVFNSNNTWYPSPNLVSADVVILAAGAGGGAGWGGSYNSAGGGGGGGGGVVPTNIPASFLPKTNGVFDGIPIYVGAGGSAGTTSGAVGSGGGNSAIATYLTGGGGNGGGGAKANGGDGLSGRGIGGSGGAGAPRGGNGGTGGVGGGIASGGLGGDSTSEYSLAGGGGGGGGGQGDSTAGASTYGAGGQGGISPGGVSPGQAGSSPSSAVTTGGGGGAGGARIGSGNPLPGGAGAYPSGGGGGGGVKGGTAFGGAWSPGGIGAAGRIYIIERFI